MDKYYSNFDLLMYNLEKLYIKFFPKKKCSFEDYCNTILLREEANKEIKNLLLSNKPVMMCRLGSVELSVLSRYLEGKKYLSIHKVSITKNAGFFPPTKKMLDRFCELYIENIKKSDLFAVWLKYYENVIINKYANRAKLVLLHDYSSPYFSTNPWSEALKGKKVLVIHPFVESIKYQYLNNRDKLFSDKRVLPKFELKTLKAVQSIGGRGHRDFKDWFEALNYMKDKIEKIDFDIAIIGAGAYGLPLAGYIKSLGKKAIHLGGATQILFGIKGKRWEEINDFKKLFNKYWIRPFDNEKPSEYKKVENGCYW